MGKGQCETERQERILEQLVGTAVMSHGCQEVPLIEREFKLFCIELNKETISIVILRTIASQKNPPEVTGFPDSSYP